MDVIYFVAEEDTTLTSSLECHTNATANLFGVVRLSARPVLFASRSIRANDPYQYFFLLCKRIYTLDFNFKVQANNFFFYELEFSYFST